MIYAITGSNGFLRDREINSLILKSSIQGLSVCRVDGRNENAIQDSLAFSPFFDAENKIVLIDNPESVAAFEGCTNDSVDIVICLDSDPKMNTTIGKYVSKLGKNHKNFPSPKEYEQERLAIDFCIQEARSYGKNFDLNLATAFVSKVGSGDLGFLSFEIKKICILADSFEQDTVTAEIIRGAVAPLAEATITPIVDALIHRSTKKLISSLDRVRKGSKEDPTMKVCIFLDNAACRLLVSSDANSKGISPEIICAETGINLWLYKNKLMIQSGSWEKEELCQLIKAIAESKRLVLEGANNPWVGLVSRLLQFTN